MKDESADDSGDQVAGKRQSNYLNKKCNMESSETYPSLGCRDTNQAYEKRTEQESSNAKESLDSVFSPVTSTVPTGSNQSATEVVRSETGADRQMGEAGMATLVGDGIGVGSSSVDIIKLLMKIDSKLESVDKRLQAVEEMTVKVYGIEADVRK